MKKNKKEKSSALDKVRGYLGELQDLDERYEEYKDKLKIDKHALDTAFVRQPTTFQEVNEILTHTISYRDGVKDKLKDIENGLYDVVKSEIEAEGTQKTTVKEIESRVASHSDLIKARDMQNTASTISSRWFGLKESYIQRGQALKELSSLLLAGYYSTPTGSTKRGSRSK